MGFILEKYNNTNKANLIVAFQGDTSTKTYTPTNDLNEAMAYFNMYIVDNTLYVRTEEEQEFFNTGITINDMPTYREKVNSLLTPLDDETAIQNAILFPIWKPNINYIENERIRYNGYLYKVLQSHTSQTNWTPNIATSLFAQVLVENPDIIVDWIQPLSTNPYSLGDIVKHNGYKWQSMINNNVWEPGIVENTIWKNISILEPEENNTSYSEWAPPDANNAYMTGARVIFEGQIYESTIDNNVWSPSDYPAGWTLIVE